MGGKGSAPKPPDMTQIANAQIESARIWQDVAMDQLAQAKSFGDMGMKLLMDVLGPQKENLMMALENAKKDRARYEDVYQPIEDDLIKEFQEFDSPERREKEAATRMADTRQAFEAQRANAEQRLAGLGIDPSQLKANALDRGIRLAEAAATAQAGNQGRQYVEQMGRALRGEAINIGRGMPAQVAQSMGLVNQTAGGMTGNYTNTAGGMAGMYAPAMQAGGLAQQGYSSGANTMNMGYQNQLSQWQANADSSGAMMSGLGQLAGMGMMAWSDPKLKEKRAKSKKSAAKAIEDSPSETYEYKASTGLDDGERHIGPMADDLKREMGVGDGSKYALQDLVGVQQQAIGELNQKVDALAAALERGGDVGRSYALPAHVLDEEGRGKFRKLVEKHSKGRDA